MIENRDVAFSLDGRTFLGICKLGFRDGDGSFAVAGWTTPAPAPRGSYYTWLPISSRKYREQHPTRAGFRVSAPDTLVVYDDHGERHVIGAPADIIAELEAECAAVALTLRGAP